MTQQTLSRPQSKPLDPFVQAAHRFDAKIRWWEAQDRLRQLRRLERVEREWRRVVLVTRMQVAACELLMWLWLAATFAAECWVAWKIIGWVTQ